VDEVVKHSKDGIRSLQSGLSELEKYGYLKRTMYHTEGHFGGMSWELSDTGDFPVKHKTCPTENAVDNKICPTGNVPLLNINNTNHKEILNKKENISSSARDSLDNTTKNIESRQNAFELYQITVGVLTPTQNQILSEYIQNLSDEVVQFAINSMANQTERRSFNYLNKILMRYEQLGIHTVEQAEKLEKQHQESMKRVRPKQKKKSKRKNTLPF